MTCPRGVCLCHVDTSAAARSRIAVGCSFYYCITASLLLHYYFFVAALLLRYCCITTACNCTGQSQWRIKSRARHVCFVVAHVAVNARPVDVCKSNQVDTVAQVSSGKMTASDAAWHLVNWLSQSAATSSTGYADLHHSFIRA